MEWTEVKGKWNQIKGRMRQQFGKLTDDDFERAAGHRDELIGKVQQRYGIAKEDAERRLDRFVQDL
jgi:uncharacterized protein YjbJ (UPF0337 family)